MVFKNEEEVKNLIRLNMKLPSWVEEARKDHKEWKALFYGERFVEELLRIEHIESEKRAEARQKYSRPIKDLNQKLSRPIDAVYSAVGGSKNYDLTLTTSQQKDLLKQVVNVRDGKSLEKWLESFWAKDLYIVDPSGLLFMEYKEEKWIKPTYKTIGAIRNYFPKGQKLDWLIFEPEKLEGGKEIWRVVDDETDWRFLKDGDTITLVNDKTFSHPFGEVPGLTCSNIQRLGKERKFSPYDSVKENQQEFMRDQSILSLYKFMNGFPLPHRTAIICHECRGTGKVDHKQCPICSGTGELFKKDVTDEIIIPISMDAEEIKVPDAPAGYTSPPLEIWDQYIKEMDRSTLSQYDTLWGVTMEVDQTQKTATEALLNAQPKINKLNEWSDVAQYMEWQLTEWIGNWMFPTKEKKKKISAIFYGRAYLIRTAKQILDDLKEAINDGLPDTVKSKLYQEYITTKYKNSPSTLLEELKKSRLEYWPFYNIGDVKNIMGDKAAKMKMNFTDWWESLSPADIAKPEDQLTKQRDDWMNQNIEGTPAPITQ